MFEPPPRLKQGSRVAVVAPSGPVPEERMLASLAWLRERYDVWLPGSLFDREGYLAGIDEVRAEALSAAMLDPKTRAIVCARGGYGAGRIVGALPWEKFAAQPKWIVGYSDVTVLHAECTRLGVASLHADNAGTLARASAAEQLAWLRALEHGEMDPWQKLYALRAGDVEGTLVGGNLSLLVAQAAAGRLVWPADAIVVIEDVGEKPYRVDRMLNALRDRLSVCRAVVFGQFSDCNANADGVTVADVLSDFANRVSVPVYGGAPFGHCVNNAPILLGAYARLIGGTLSCGVGGA